MDKGFRIPVRCVDGLTQKVASARDRMAQTAYERWIKRRGSGLRVHAWWKVERNLIVNAVTRIREWGHGLIVEIDCPEVDPLNVRVFMSPSDLLVVAPIGECWLFKYVHLRALFDNADASAEIQNGVLRISITRLNAPDEQKMHFRVA